MRESGCIHIESPFPSAVSLGRSTDFHGSREPSLGSQGLVEGQLTQLG